MEVGVVLSLLSRYELGESMEIQAGYLVVMKIIKGFLPCMLERFSGYVL